MSKVTIRFWNQKKERYEAEDQWLAVEDSGNVIFINDAPYSNDLTVSVIEVGIEPHIYKDGERIA